MNFNKILITNKSDLLEYKEHIFKLFEDCFKLTMDEKLWNWAYLDNPNGSPIVSLYFDDEKLVGHYAVIPVALSLNNLEIKAVLSMTTMVHSAYRRYGVFVSQAKEVYQKATDLGFDLVYGFPNKKSAPGFKKRLMWKVDQDSYVAKLNISDLFKINVLPPESIRFNTLNEKNINWRLNKPNQEYEMKSSCILKKYGESFDVVFFDNDIQSMDENVLYNILINSSSGDFFDKKQFDYTFGYRLFNQNLSGVSFKTDLIMSDVF